MAIEVPLIIKLATEAAALAEWKGTGIAAAFGEYQFGRLMNRRTEAAREILQQEIAQGGKRPMAAAAEEEGAAIVYRYLHAAREGAARLNLRLLAQIIAGQVADGAIRADEFLYYADLLSPLRREELLYLGQLYRLSLDWRPDPQTYAGADFDLTHMNMVMRELRSALVPKVYADDRTFDVAGAALVRTALLLPMQDKKHGTGYMPSPLLLQLVDMIDIEAAVAAEADNDRQEPTLHKTTD